MPTTARRPDIDWLRVVATYLLFVFHVGEGLRPRAVLPHPQRRDVVRACSSSCGFIGLWHMPLFFLLAGWSRRLAAERAAAAASLRERVARLGVPLVAGCVLLRAHHQVPRAAQRPRPEPQRPARRARAPGRASGSSIPSGLRSPRPSTRASSTFLPTFFTQLDRFTWAHLWFVAYLLTLHAGLAAALPRRCCADASAHGVRSRGMGLRAARAARADPAHAARPSGPGIQNLYDDWANVAYYATFLLRGFCWRGARALEARVRAEWRRASRSAAATGVLLAGVLGASRRPVVLAGTAVAGWCFVVALLGVARERVTAGTRLRYLIESALPDLRPAPAGHRGARRYRRGAAARHRDEVRAAAGGLGRRDARHLPLRSCVPSPSRASRSA